MIILLVIIGLSILILGHEAGHFLAAKKFGLKVDEFGFGFPPRIFAWRPKAKKNGTLRPGLRLSSAENPQGEQARSETEYSINWLPFGGFVKIAGENDRISGETEKLSSLPEEEKKRIFLFQPAWKRSVIILAGVTVNFILGWILFSAVLMIGTPKALIITEVQKGSPAEEAGIKANDIVKNFVDSETFINFVNSNRGKEIGLTVLREGEEVSFKAVPRVKTGENEGALGVGLQAAGADKEGFFSAVVLGFKQTVFVTEATFKGFYQIVLGIISSGKISSDVAGPVGIFSIANQISKIGLAYLINLVALISINLAVINLIPFPALDGGRFFMILIEKVKGSPVPVKAEAIINGVGFALLLALMAVVTVRDVMKLF